MALRKIPIPPKAPAGLEQSWTFLNRLFTNLQRRLPRYRFHSAAQVKLTVNQSIANSTWTAISWDKELYDDEDLWDSGSATKFTIPQGFDGRAVLTTNAAFTANGTGIREFRIVKNGSAFDGTVFIAIDGSSSTSTRVNGSTAIVDVSENDEFELEARQTSGGSLDFLAGNTSFFNIILYEKSAK